LTGWCRNNEFAAGDAGRPRLIKDLVSIGIDLPADLDFAVI
jgi:hypothetical protein